MELGLADAEGGALGRVTKHSEALRGHNYADTITRTQLRGHNYADTITRTQLRGQNIRRARVP